MPLPSLTDWIDQYASELDAVIMDIDGVLIIDGRRLPRSRKLLDALARIGLPYTLLTNDGNHSTQEKALGLANAGLTVAPALIVSCGHAIAPLARDNGYTGQTFFVMGDTGTPCYAEAAGLKTTRDPKALNDCQGVIIGEENYDWEPVINSVVNYYIDHPDAALIVPNPDEFYPGGGFKIHIAAGGISRFIQQVLKAYGLSIAPIYLGKPFSPIFQMAHRRLENRLGKPIPPRKILMVGDNIAADIAGGRQAGFKTALMLTGVTSAASLTATDVQPDLVFKSL